VSNKQSRNMADQQEMSKGAKRRANKKAREAAEPTVEQPAPEIKPETSEPKAKAKGKATAEAKAEVKAEPKAEPKAKAKAEAKAKAKAKAEPKAKSEPKAKAQSKSEPSAAEAKTEPPKAAAKPAAKSKQSAKKKAPAPQVEEEEAPKKREPSPDRFIQYDDGSGEAWETSTGVSKKAQKQKERLEQKKQMEKVQGVKPGSTAMVQHIPGLTVTGDKAANTASKTAGSQAVTATAVASVAAIAEKEGGPVKEVRQLSTATITVPEKKIGILIGPKGSTIKLIQEKTGAKLDTSNSNSCSIVGSADEVAAAEIAVRELLDKGYTALQYDDFQEHFVAVHPSAFPDIIGKEGVVIRAIKDKLGVSVNIPGGAPKDAKPEKKVQSHTCWQKREC